MVPNILVLLSLVLTAYAVETKIKINYHEQRTKPLNSNSSVVIGHYYFDDNELAFVECSGIQNTFITFTVKDEPDIIFSSFDKSYIYMYMKMRIENDGKYIDCHVIESGVVTIVRIMLMRKPRDTSEDGWTLQVEDTFWVSPPRYINYLYLPDETLNITCKTSDTHSSFRNDVQKEMGAYFIKNYQPSLYIGRYLQCPDTISNYKTHHLSFISLYVKGLQGLRSHNILYYYMNWGEVEIHYAYKDEQSLELTWIVRPEEYTKMYKVFWKDALVSSISASNISNHAFKIDPITPGPNDDRSVIGFGSTLNRDVLFYSLRIVLRRQSPIMETVRGINNLENVGQDKYYLYKVIVPVIFLLILIVSLAAVVMKKRTSVVKMEQAEEAIDMQFSKRQNTCVDIQSQKETGVCTAGTLTEDDINPYHVARHQNIDDLYSKPIPKSRRISNELNYTELQLMNEPKYNNTNSPTHPVRQQSMYSEVHNVQPNSLYSEVTHKYHVNSSDSDYANAKTDYVTPYCNVKDFSINDRTNN